MGVTIMDNQLIQQLHDKQSITEVLLTYTRAIDTLDENLLRSVFHSDSEHNHTFVGPSSNPNLPSTATEPGDFVAYALNFLKRFVKTHHQLGPPLITVAGPSETDQSAQATAQEPKTEWSVGGRYVDELEKRDDVWKIRRRTGFADWRRTK
jgi:hypothetical protein